MSNRIKELISSLKKAIIETADEPEKKPALNAMLKQLKKSTVDENELAKKVIELVCEFPDIMRKKHKAFKRFCQSLKPTKIELEEKTLQAFFGEINPSHKHKPKSRR